MHRYEELEKEYYKKRILKALFGLVAVLTVFFAGYFTYKRDISNKTVIEAKKEIKQKPEINKTVKKEEKKAQKNVDKLIFVVPHINEDEIKDTKKTVKKTKKPEKKEVKKEIKKEVKKPKVQIKEKSITLNELKQKFSQKPSYDLAIMIAKNYFNKKDYKQAQIWAIKANNIDPQKVESWVLFSDILLKENKKQKAREILQIYIDQYGENETIRSKLRTIKY